MLTTFVCFHPLNHFFFSSFFSLFFSFFPHRQDYVDQVERYLDFRKVPEKIKVHVRHYFKYGKVGTDTGRKEVARVFRGFPIGTKMGAIEDAPFRVLQSCKAFVRFFLLFDDTFESFCNRDLIDTFSFYLFYIFLFR